MSAASPVGSVDFDKEVLQADKLVLVDFWAQWCGPCKMIAPLLDEVARELSDKVKIVKVNVDDEPELSQKFNVSSIPTLVFFKDGQLKETLVGSLPKKALVEKINTLA